MSSNPIPVTLNTACAYCAATGGVLERINAGPGVACADVHGCQVRQNETEHGQPFPRTVLVLPDVDHTGRTVTLILPAVPPGFTRLYRFTVHGNRRGHYSPRPQTGWGPDMFYCDVPAETYSQLPKGDTNGVLLSGEHAVKVSPLAEAVAIKRYEAGDWEHAIALGQFPPPEDQP